MFLQIFYGTRFEEPFYNKMQSGGIKHTELSTLNLEKGIGSLCFPTKTMWDDVAWCVEIESDDNYFLEKLESKILSEEIQSILPILLQMGLLKLNLYQWVWEVNGDEKPNILLLQKMRAESKDKIYETVLRLVHPYLDEVHHHYEKVEVPCGPCGGTTKPPYYENKSINWFALKENPYHKEIYGWYLTMDGLKEKYV